ncbi:MAG: GAF domain-containing protein [Gemmatimonadaceae bacterium]
MNRRRRDVTGEAKETELAMANDLGALRALMPEPFAPHGQTRDAAKHAKAQLEDVLDSMSDAFYAYDHELRFIRMNRAAREIMLEWGVDPNQVIGKHATEVFPALGESPIGEAMRRCAAARVAVTIEDVGPLTQRWLEMRLYPTADGITVYVRDITARKRADFNQQLLADAGRLLSSSINRGATLAAVADLVVPALADWFLLHLFDETNRLEPVVSKHFDPAKREIVAAYHARYPAYRTGSTASVVAETGVSRIHAHLSDDALASMARDSEHLRVLRSLGIRSTMTVPLTARERRLGALSFVRGEAQRRYDESDLALAEELAQRIALALDNVSLLDAAQKSADRTERLQLATAAFAQALTAEEVAEIVLSQGLAALKAGAGVVYLMDETGNTLLATAWHGIAEEAFAQWMSTPVTSSMLVADAVRQRVPLYAPDRERVLDQYPTAREANRLIEQDAWAAIPLIHGDRPLGALALGFSTRREFSSEDRALIEAMAQQCSLALERARLFESEQKARRAAERLQSLTTELSEATTVATVGEAVMEHGVSALGAYAGVLALHTPAADELEILSSIGYPAAACMSAGRRWSATATIPICEAARTGDIIFLGSPQAWGDRYLGGYAPPHSRSAAWAAIPFTVEGQRRGALLWTFDDQHVFDNDERALMVAIARQCAQALERARLFDAERTARTMADEANRAKTDFLAVMSHELRTPLNAIAGYAELLEIGVHGPLTSPQREAIASIQRSQRDLLGLIDNVLHFAHIEGNRVELDVQPVHLHATLRALEPWVTPLLPKKALRYRYDPCSPDLTVQADSDKLRQILLNLLSNAIKFTDVGGAIVVSCVVEEHFANVRVADNGRGIPPDKLERIFDPFVQLSAGRTRTHSGAGLGLSISRDLARTMGGDLTVRSVVLHGSVFTLRLPRK